MTETKMSREVNWKELRAGGRVRRVEAATAWVKITAPNPWRRGRLFRLAACFCLLASPVWAGDEDAETDRALRRTLTTGTIRAFVKGNRIRMYWEAEGPGATFKARWKRGFLDDRDHAYYTAELEREKTPPRIPGSSGAWHEVAVLDQESWRRYAQRAREQLVPKEPGHGVYVQLMDGEGVLVRDSKGQIQSYDLQDKPADANVLRRYNAHEFATQIARLVESDLTSRYPEQTCFLGVYLSASFAPRFILFDFSRRACVVLHGPWEMGREDGAIPFSSEFAIADLLARGKPRFCPAQESGFNRGPLVECRGSVLCTIDHVAIAFLQRLGSCVDRDGGHGSGRVGNLSGQGDRHQERSRVASLSSSTARTSSPCSVDEWRKPGNRSI